MYSKLDFGIVPKGYNGILVSRISGSLVADGTIYKQKKLWGKYIETSYYFELADEWKENVELVAKWVEKLIKKKGSIKSYRGSWRYRKQKISRIFTQPWYTLWKEVFNCYNS